MLIEVREIITNNLRLDFKVFSVAYMTHFSYDFYYVYDKFVFLTKCCYGGIVNFFLSVVCWF